MINFSLLISSATIEGPGGLFDINATLPLVAIQFLILMYILNIVFYSPLSLIIKERKKYILNNLAKASELLTHANELTQKYEQELTNIRKQTQLEILNSQKVHKEILDIELNISQTSINGLLDIITKDLAKKKEKALSNLDNIVQTLCIKIENKLSF